MKVSACTFCSNFSNAGASVMLGADNGFCTLLSEALHGQGGKKLLCQHCLAHRIQLVMKNVNSGTSPKCPNCLLLEKYNNKLAAFYSKSGKKKRHLKKFCIDKGFTRFQLHKTFEVRWVQSHAAANEKVFDNFYSLVLHLRKIQVDRLFRKDKKTKELTPQGFL